MKILHINTFDDIQELKDQMKIRVGVSMTQWVREVLEYLREVDQEDEVEMHINPELLPAAYAKWPYIMVKNLTTRGIYPSLQATIRGGVVSLFAGQTPRKLKFIQAVIDDLEETGVSKHFYCDIPEGYQRQPYVFLARLRDRGVSAKLRIVNKTITYYVPSKRKLPVT